MGIFSYDDLTPEFWESEGFENLSRNGEWWCRLFLFYDGTWIDIKICRSRIGEHYIAKYNTGRTNTKLSDGRFDIHDRGDWYIFKEKHISKEVFNGIMY